LVVSLILWFGAGLDPDDPTQWAWIMLATVGASTLVWLCVTFATRPEDGRVLRDFYLRVRPGGRGWRRVTESLGLGRQPVDGGPLNWTNWVAGVTCVYSSLFGVGRILFGDLGAGVLFLVLAAVCFAWIARNLGPAARAAKEGKGG
ncbi:MAG: hypothetical protein JSW71_06475, partial [Gemmatimonadota bacterium]